MAMIETTSFRLVEGVTDDRFVEADARFETEFVYQQTGLIRRTITRDAESERWQSFVVWYDAVSADASRARELLEPVASEYRSLIVGDSIERHRFETVR
jgi:hypothetical protein